MIKKWTGGTKEEYETQYFGFGCQTMQLSLRRFIESGVVSTVKNMDKHLQETFELNNSDKEVVSKSCDKLTKLLLRRADGSFQALDEEVEKIFSIPENLLLPSDEDQKEVTKEEFAKIRGEVDELKRKVKRAALMEKLLSTELEEMESLDKQCELANKSMQLVDSWGKKIDEISSNSHLREVDTLYNNLPFLKNDNLDLFMDFKE